MSDRTAKDVYDATINRERDLVRLGYTIRSMWGCELTAQQNQKKEMKRFFENKSNIMPLDPITLFLN